MNGRSRRQQIGNPLADAQPPPAPENGSGIAAEGASLSGAGVTHNGGVGSGSAEQRRRGPRSARRLAQRLRAGRDLPPDKLLLLDLTCRLATHAQNLSLRLYRDQETRQDGESKVALQRLADLVRQVGDNLRLIFGDGDDAGGDDPLSRLLGGQR